MTWSNVAKALLGVGAAILGLGLFLAYTAARPEVILYGLLGAAICVVLAFVLRKPSSPSVPRERS